jgi:spore coat polysaccharide biosynthesis protein SpsF (cytidylyltransferase family)
MKVLTIMQARVSSFRLPGKILLQVLGESMLFRQIERSRRTGRIDHLTIATSTDRSDDALAETCIARKTFSAGAASTMRSIALSSVRYCIGPRRSCG